MHTRLKRPLGSAVHLFFTPWSAEDPYNKQLVSMKKQTLEVVHIMYTRVFNFISCDDVENCLSGDIPA